MEAKFTKGQWKAKTCEVAIPNAIVYLSNKGGFDLSGCPDAVANAHLIAAAPEMYEILKACSGILNQAEQCHTAKAIDELLAKARGEL